jgi:nitroreductase
MDSIRELLRRSRSYRRFFEENRIEREVLEELVDASRYAPSAANRQPLKYILSYEPAKNELIFPHLTWAGYLEDWPGPVEGERPAAYIIILGDTAVHPSFGCDHGIAAQTILLAAAEQGIGGCIIGSIDRKALRSALALPERYEMLLVLALGRPKEQVVLEETAPDGDIRYWRGSDGVHYVPKRPLDELILE